MHTELSVRDVMERDYVGVSEGDSAREAARLLREEGASAAVVLRGSEPVGLLTEQTALTVLADGIDPTDASVGDVMAAEVPSIEAEAELERAADRMNSDDRWLLVREADGTTGLVTESDLLSAASIESPSMEGTNAPTQHHDQSICERCGALARDLLDRDGELVCASCRAD